MEKQAVIQSNIDNPKSEQPRTADDFIVYCEILKVWPYKNLTSFRSVDLRCNGNMQLDNLVFRTRPNYPNELQPGFTYYATELLKYYVIFGNAFCVFDQRTMSGPTNSDQNSPHQLVRNGSAWGFLSKSQHDCSIHSIDEDFTGIYSLTSEESFILDNSGVTSGNPRHYPMVYCGADHNTGNRKFVPVSKFNQVFDRMSCKSGAYLIKFNTGKEIEIKCTNISLLRIITIARNIASVECNGYEGEVFASTGEPIFHINRATPSQLNTRYDPSSYYWAKEIPVDPLTGRQVIATNSPRLLSHFAKNSYGELFLVVFSINEPHPLHVHVEKTQRVPPENVDEVEMILKSEILLPNLISRLEKFENMAASNFSAKDAANLTFIKHPIILNGLVFLTKDIGDLSLFVFQTDGDNIFSSPIEWSEYLYGSVHMNSLGFTYIKKGYAFPEVKVYGSHFIPPDSDLIEDLYWRERIDIINM
jgi:hypothetical protein